MTFLIKSKVIFKAAFQVEETLVASQGLVGFSSVVDVDVPLQDALLNGLKNSLIKTKCRVVDVVLK